MDTGQPDSRQQDNQVHAVPVDGDSQSDSRASHNNLLSEVATPGLSGAKSKLRFKRRQLLAVVSVTVLAVSCGVWYFVSRPAEPVQTAQTQQRQPQSQTDKAAEAKVLPDVGASEQEQAIQRFLHPTTGETWLAEWKSLPDQKFWKDSPEVTYYEVGARNANKIVASVRMEMGEVINVFEVAADNSARLVLRPDADQSDEYNNTQWYKDALVAKVQIDTSIHYDSLTLPRSLTLQNGHVLKKSAYGGLGDRPTSSEGQAVTDVQKFGDSTVQLLERSDSTTNLTSIGYGIMLPLHTRVLMEFQPLEVDLKDYTWTQGVTKVEDSVAAIARGCGGLFASVTRADTLADNDTIQVGKSPSGLAVYELTSLEHPLMQKAYQEHKEFYGDTPSDWNKYPNISQEDFARQHAVVLYHDPTGQWLVYARNDLRPQGGCAKPVVYLYPQRTQQVSLRVGAHVTVSDPFYDPLKGWKATAYPGGSLLVGGRLYDSLLWEGPGIGEYPAITAGTVVKTTDAPATMRAQLAAQGLTQKEADDFMDYWQSKLPRNKPYVRLTWFTTQQVNQLAPLAVSPRPDTTIRVFLDFEGLDMPIKLPAQQLQAIPRNGFTVVEWGGLAHQPLHK